ncbi:MAG: ATP-binding protein [Deltaproteobacteria bacterium]|nr:ATP-binding protein [Deltaproteobacteria bacterium]
MDIHRQIIQWALDKNLIRDRMSFIAGPRQVGKTTAIRNFLKKSGQAEIYYNWDTPTVKKRYAKNPIFFTEDVPPQLPVAWVALDEIHKYPKWKNILKGYYDEFKGKFQFIVTGSAMLETFRKSGDSLVGRYFLFHMLPLGVWDITGPMPPAENMWNPTEVLSSVPEADKIIFDASQNLLSITGFPEPLVAGTKEFCTKWREDHISLIIREDLRDLSRIIHLQKLEALLYLLPQHVASPLSINSLTNPLECAHGALKTWLLALQKVYLIFPILPWTIKVARSIRKEAKYYFWDWGIVENEGGRFENFVAVMLFRAVSAWNEWGKGVFKLHYLRTKDGREVDFAISERGRLVLIVEAKSKETNVSPDLIYFKEKLGVSLAIQVVNKDGYCTMKGKNLYVMGIDRLLKLLP